ncbi:hypothetical protein LCGC14_1810760, partial [marine sediment metagenome]
MRKFLLIFRRAIAVGLVIFAAGSTVLWAEEIENLFTVDGSNVARFPESMAPSAVNNGARALEGMLARFYNDLGCRISTGGSANAYTFAASQAITAYYDGLILCFDANFANTGTATLNVDGQGAKTIQRNGAALPAGAIETDQKVLVTYDGTNFEVLSVARAVTSASDVITDRGDIIIGGVSAAITRLGVGVSGQYLGSDGTDAVWTAITSGELPAGSVVQVAVVQGGAVATGTTAIPYDDSIPQITEGDQYMSLAITPNSSANLLVIQTVAQLAHSVVALSMTCALFQDSTANALAAIANRTPTLNVDTPRIVSFTHQMTAGTASGTTF